MLLRYFKNHDLRTAGAALGISDDAAQKRVSRAVEHLREFFARRGVTVAVLDGAGIYEARQASQLREQIQTLQQQQAPVGEQIQALQREREETTKQLTALRDDNERLIRNKRSTQMKSKFYLIAITGWTAG